MAARSKVRTFRAAAANGLPMKIAVQFGAGNIGRGFLGQVFHESGYETAFVDVADGLVRALNERGEYPVRIVEDPPHTLAIRNIRAVNGRDVSAVAQALSVADIAATAVGVPVMETVAASIAAGLALRFQRADAAPLNIIVCENMLGAGPFMREKVREHLAPMQHELLDQQVGFVEASIGRMVPVLTDALRAEDPLLVAVEAYCDLPVDADAFRGSIPPIAHLMPRSNFAAYVERKLFVHNMGHAVAAYLGARRGCTYIWEAMANTAIAETVTAAMDETCHALAAKYNLDLGELRAHASDLRRRFCNRALGDRIDRVARDPLRKLGPNDRLVGALTLCLDAGVEPSDILAGVAAAIEYGNPEDSSAVALQTLRRERGLDGVLTEVCGLPPESEAAQRIRSAYARAVG